MKIIQINTTCGVGSTGKICMGISQLMSNKDVENYILYGNISNGYDLGIQCSNKFYVKIQSLKSRIFGNYGFNSYSATKKMISLLEKISPDIVHLHNIHSHDCNLKMLFEYFKKTKIKLVWTFHDCWAFTAYCPHFSMVKCDKWKDQCYKCDQLHMFSWFFDKSSKLYKEKAELFSNLDLTIVTPSAWLADLVKQSFLKEYPVRVINNGIDLRVFQPKKSDFRCRYGLEKKKIVLGVSFDWEIGKGIDVFAELASRLPDNYQIVIVGTDDKVDEILPINIISIHRTQSQEELVEIYSVADVFINPTRQENYPTVNMEALACGTPVVTFKTGGSPEMLDATCGSIVDCDDIDALEREIIRICQNNPYSREACTKKALTFDKNERFKEYLNLYEGINATRT